MLTQLTGESGPAVCLLSGRRDNMAEPEPPAITLAKPALAAGLEPDS